MLEILSIITAGGPWVLGSAIGYLVCTRNSTAEGVSAVFAGAGGYLGYILLAALMMITDRLGYSVFSYPFSFIVVLSSVVAAALCIRSLARRASYSVARGEPKAPRAAMALNLLVFLILALQAATTYLTPVGGWDVVDYWGPIASDIVRYQDSTTDFFQLESPRSLRHPATISYLLAWSSGSTGVFNISTAGWPWFLMTISCGLTTYGSSLSFGNDRLLSKFLCIGAITTPLASNHVFSAGYAELVLVTGLLSGSALVCLYLTRGSVAALIVGLLACCSLMTVKNTGFAYGILPIFALLIVSLYKHSAVLLCSLVATLVACAVALTLQSYQGGAFIAANLGFNFDEGYFALAGKKLYFITPGFDALFAVYKASLLKNSSFNIIAIVLALIFLFILGNRRGIVSNLPELYWFVIFFAGFCGTTFILFTDYGFAHAIQRNDTGNSRLMLPILMCVFPLVACISAGLSPKVASGSYR